MSDYLYRTIDMHTAGEPVRIIVSGYPKLQGRTILEKRRDALAHHDVIRQRLMLEPRGHADMYGVIPTEPSAPGADLAVLFMHHSGYSTMCGHATIAIGRWAVESALIPVTRPTTEFALECPCGVVKVKVSVDERVVGPVSFESVPAFVERLDFQAQTPSFGSLSLDIAFGGAFYAILPSSRIGLDFFKTPFDTLVAAGREITNALRAQTTISHPTEPDLAFVYGTILTDDETPGSGQPSANLCIFGEGQVDRSPTGSGVTARVALDHARGLLRPGMRRDFRGFTGPAFTGEMVREEPFGTGKGVIVRVEGRSHVVGESRFTLDPEDPLGDGFSIPRDLTALLPG